MTKEFLVNILTVPSCTDHEGFLAECIQNWCNAAGVQCKKDGAGNLFLTKGSPPSGQYYPGATAHIDTVHSDQAADADAKKLLTPKVEGDKITMWHMGKKWKRVERKPDNKKKPRLSDGGDIEDAVIVSESDPSGDSRLDMLRGWYSAGAAANDKAEPGSILQYDMVEEEALVQTGTGSDDKNAVAIVLSIMSQVPFMKAALFTGEEAGMKGAKAADMSFFDDVSWVFGCDSPGPANRMTKSLMGVRIYGKEFGEKWLEPVCKKHGVTDARAESYTDIHVIREKTKLDCCNINNGGYNAHTSTEYALYSETCATEELGLDLVKSIPLDVRHTSEPEREQYSFGGYGGYGGYGGGSYSDWWDQYLKGSAGAGRSGPSRLGKWGRRTRADEQPSSGWLPGMGPKDGKTATLRWKFSSKGKANTYFLKMKRMLPWCRLRVEDTEVSVAGPYGDMKKAFIEAYNIDNEVNRPESNVDVNPALARAFRNAVTVDEPPKAEEPKKKKVATAKPKKKEDREDDTCAICLDLETDEQAEDFVESLQIEGTDVRATVEDADPGDPAAHYVTITGKLKDVKQAYATFYSIVNRAFRIQTFSDVEADGGAGEFWDCVEFAEQDEAQDEVGASAAPDEIEDADFTMKDDSAFGDDLMSESEEW